MNKTTIMNNLTRTFYRTKFKVQKHSPEILVAAGVGGVVTSAVMACRATTKLTPILDEMKRNLEVLNDAIENPEKLPEGHTVEAAKKELGIVTAKAGLNIAKLYAPSVMLGVVSLSAILYSHKILSKRNIALGAAYATIDKSFKQYRGRVVERFGDALDKELRCGIKAEEFEEIEVNDKGKEKIVKKVVDVVEDPNNIGDFARVYDDGNVGWTKDPNANLIFLKQQQAYANEKLKMQGWLPINDVYEMLGYPKIPAGQVAGWTYGKNASKDADGYVDFGIYDINKKANRDFVNGYERCILLDFNLDVLDIRDYM